MGEIDQTTGKPCVNWAEIPVVRYVDKNAYNENANVVGIVNANDNADSVSVGSNKSVGLSPWWTEKKRLLHMRTAILGRRKARRRLRWFVRLDEEL